MIAKQRLSKILLNRIESIDGLAASVGDTAFAGMSPIVSPTVSAKANPSAKTASGNGRWSELTIIEALQDFRGSDQAHLWGLTKALLAAGIVPMNQPNGPALDEREAAELCASFYRRHGRWPNWADAKRRSRSGEPLPAVSAMERLFGGTSEHAVREACERILAGKGADVVALHPERREWREAA